VESKLTVPFWIRNGTRDIKREFLRAIFDDDGSVLYTKKYPSKNVNLHFTRLKTRSKNLIAMFGEIKQMLKELGIYSNEPYTARTYSVGGQGRVVMGIFISDYRNMVKFHKTIGFTQVEKNLRLIRCLKNRKGGGNHLRKKDIESISDWKRADSHRAVS
jgi:intein/homing endonuclease